MIEIGSDQHKCQLWKDWHDDLDGMLLAFTVEFPSIQAGEFAGKLQFSIWILYHVQMRVSSKTCFGYQQGKRSLLRFSNFPGCEAHLNHQTVILSRCQDFPTDEEAG